MKTVKLYSTSKTVFLSTLMMGLFSTQSFAADFPTRPELIITKCEDSTVSDENRLGSFKPPEAEPLIGSILISAAITAGIDFIGQKLSDAAEESMKTSTASFNVFPNSEKISARCLTFRTAQEANLKGIDAKSVEFKIRLDGKSGANGVPYYMNPKLEELKYYRTLSGKLNKERGLMIQLAISGPGNANAQSQTINIGNVKTQNGAYSGGSIPFPTMINPYVVRTTDDKGKTTKPSVGGPFTISVTLTEVKDANEAVSYTHLTLPTICSV